MGELSCSVSRRSYLTEHSVGQLLTFSLPNSNRYLSLHSLVDGRAFGSCQAGKSIDGLACFDGLKVVRLGDVSFPPPSFLLSPFFAITYEPLFASLRRQ